MRLFIVITIFFVFGCQTSFKELPILSYKINSSGEKINYSITYEHFTNQLGRPFSTDDIKDKVFIANFFFTRCPSICPPMRTVLVNIAENFSDNTDFLIVSHTINPENDTVEVLKQYSEATGISNQEWQFVRSSEENTRHQANQFMTNFRPYEDGIDFYHSSYVALVDKHQLIRGFYNILVIEEVERLKKDIQSLLN